MKNRSGNVLSIYVMDSSPYILVLASGKQMAKQTYYIFYVKISSFVPSSKLRDYVAQ